MFSVIVPVYNVEQYLDKCLASILGQTYKDFECIVVDDGSTDNSSAIIDKYVKQDQRFKVLHQKNMGPSAARNAGLVIEVLTNSQKTVCFEAPSTEVIKQNILADIWPSYPWNKCYKKYLFENIRFPVGKIFEDVLTIPELCLSGEKIVCIPDKLYYYNRQNVNSITAKINVKKLYDLFLGRLKNRQLAVLHNIDCLKALDKIMVKDTMKCLFRQYNDNELSEAQEQKICDYLKERLDKYEITGLRNRFWVKMLLAKRKKLCAWYARFRSYI